MSVTHKATHHDGAEAFSSDLGELKEGFTHLRSEVNDLLKSAVDAGQSGVVAVREKAAEAVKGLREKGSDSLEALGERIAERPLTSALIAVGVGYMLAKWMNRR